jgi:hypothetical protein
VWEPRAVDPATAAAEKVLREAGPEHPVVKAVKRLAEEQYASHLAEAVQVKATDADRARTAAEAGAMLSFLVGLEEVMAQAKTD